MDDDADVDVVSIPRKHIRMRQKGNTHIHIV